MLKINKLLKKIRKKRALHLALGNAGEHDAIKLLLSNNYFILARNWRCFAGELDIVALDGGIIVFVEVKTRRPNSLYRPLDNLSPRQIKRNFRAGKVYLSEFASIQAPHRYDLIEVIRDRKKSLSIKHHHDFINA